MVRPSLSVLLLTLLAAAACGEHSVVVADRQATPGSGGTSPGAGGTTAGSSGADATGGTGGEAPRDSTFIIGADISWVQEEEDLVDFCQLSPELSRSFRGLRVWLPIQLCGVGQFRHNLDEKLDLALWAAERLKEIDGIVSIYLADLRYSSNEMARKYSRVRHYVDSSREAIKEMQRQVGDLEVDDEGIAVRGLIIRPLILPNDIAGSKKSLEWLVKEVSPRVTVGIMSQYYPAHRANRYPELNRRILPEEYNEAVKLVEELGIENGWLQGMASPGYYRPDFSDDKPFSE